MGYIGGWCSRLPHLGQHRAPGGPESTIRWKKPSGSEPRHIAPPGAPCYQRMETQYQRTVAVSDQKMLGTPARYGRNTWVQTERAGHEAWAKLTMESPKAAAVMHHLVANMGHQNAVVISQRTLSKITVINLVESRPPVVYDKVDTI